MVLPFQNLCDDSEAEPRAWVTHGLENVKLINRKLFRKHSKNDEQLVEADL